MKQFLWEKIMRVIGGKALARKRMEIRCEKVRELMKEKENRARIINSLKKAEEVRSYLAELRAKKREEFDRLTGGEWATEEGLKMGEDLGQLDGAVTHIDRSIEFLRSLKDGIK